MGYFFRRSMSFGPFRLNFSKSGLGASVGVPGARLTMRPSGSTYVTVGRHGFYHAGVTFNGASQTTTLNGPTVTRGAANGIGNELWFEEDSGGFPQGSITITYVNQSGNNATTPSFSLSPTSGDSSCGRTAQVPRVSGDSGVQSIVSIASSGFSTYPNTRQGTVLILREIAQYTYNFTEDEWRDALDLGLPQIDNGSCLFLMTEACVTSPSYPWGITGRIEIYQQ